MKIQTTQITEYQINRILSAGEKTELAIKALKIGFNVSFDEYAVTTFITFLKQ